MVEKRWHVGKLQKVACAAFYLATGGVSYIREQTLIVDGGQVLPESSLALEDL